MFFYRENKKCRLKPFLPIFWFFHGQKNAFTPTFNVFPRPLSIIQTHFLRIFLGLIFFCLRAGYPIFLGFTSNNFVKNSEFPKIFHTGIFCFSQALFEFFHREPLIFTGSFVVFFHGWKNFSRGKFTVFQDFFSGHVWFWDASKKSNNFPC